MTDLEKHVCTDRFMLLLLGVRRDHAAFTMAIRAQVFDGGRSIEEQDWLEPLTAPCPQTLRQIRDLLQRLVSVPHLVVLHGGGAPFLREWFDAASAGTRTLDLERTAAAAAGLDGRPGLQELAAVYGLPFEQAPGVPFTDLPEDLLWATLARAGAAGLSLQALIELTDEVQPRVSFERYEFGRAALDALPDAPGVYTMTDVHGEVLYVGKAASLYRRLWDYFRARSRVPKKLRKIRADVSGLDYQVVGSELEALLLENRLINELRPRLNTQRALAAGRSRYARTHGVLAVICRSLVPKRAELYLFGARETALQLRVMPARPPLGLLRSLVAFYSGRSERYRSHPHLTDWGRDGQLICFRYWARFRNSLTWVEVAGSPERASRRLGEVISQSCVTDQAAEFRLDPERDDP